MGPKFGAQYVNKLGSQLAPMSITKLSPNWACQLSPIHYINFLLSGSPPNTREQTSSLMCNGHPAETRSKRGCGVRRRVTGSGKIPSNWRRFLRDNNNKTSSSQMLLTKLYSCLQKSW